MYHWHLSFALCLNFPISPNATVGKKEVTKTPISQLFSMTIWREKTLKIQNIARENGTPDVFPFLPSKAKYVTARPKLLLDFLIIPVAGRQSLTFTYTQQQG